MLLPQEPREEKKIEHDGDKMYWKKPPKKSRSQIPVGTSATTLRDITGRVARAYCPSIRHLCARDVVAMQQHIRENREIHNEGHDRFRYRLQCTHTHARTHTHTNTAAVNTRVAKPRPDIGILLAAFHVHLLPPCVQKKQNPKQVQVP